MSFPESALIVSKTDHIRLQTLDEAVGTGYRIAQISFVYQPDLKYMRKTFFLPVHGFPAFEAFNEVIPGNRGNQAVSLIPGLLQKADVPGMDNVEGTEYEHCLHIKRR